MINLVDGGIKISVRVIPNSSKNLILVEDGFIKVKITAQPIEGKANKFLTEYLAKVFKVPKTSIQILKGESSKDKMLFIRVSDEEKIDFIKSCLTNS